MQLEGIDNFSTDKKSMSNWLKFRKRKEDGIKSDGKLVSIMKVKSTYI